MTGTDTGRVKPADILLPDLWYFQAEVSFPPSLLLTETYSDSGQVPTDGSERLPDFAEGRKTASKHP